MKHTMKFKRETKGTKVYEGEEPIVSLYIKNSAFGGKEVPQEITLDIKEIK